MTTTSDQMRAWDGPALLSYGFRPFFLGAALWAVVAMVLWIVAVTQGWEIPSAFEPVSWHAHAFLFGYQGAALAGFLLTAVPNWTGRLPIVGWRLGALAGLWSAGRIAVLVSAHLPPLAVALIDLAFPVLLSALILREIVAGKNWHNLIVLAMLVVFALANALFHWEAAQGDVAASGFRLGLGAAVMMVAVIGGRVVPSFTRNWLVKRNDPHLPAKPMQALDKVALLALLVALVVWSVAPWSSVTGGLLILAGGCHVVRLLRWSGLRTVGEPLVLILHVAYACVPMGTLALGAALIWPEMLAPATAQHLWMGGALGLMTLAVMTRATLGHTGGTLTADGPTVAIYAALAVAVLTRLVGEAGYAVSAVAWIAAFGGFALHYGPRLIRPRPAPQR